MKILLGTIGLEHRTIRITTPFKVHKQTLRRLGSPLPSLTWREFLHQAEKRGAGQWDRIIRDMQPRSWYELQQLSKVLSQHIHDHMRFERLLSNFDSDLQLPAMDIGTKSFIGKGSGTGSLQVYRKVSIASTHCFEKIYDNNALGLKKNLWFYRQIEPLLRDMPIQAPKLLHVAKGRKISALYFEYTETPSLTETKRALDRTADILRHFLAVDDEAIGAITDAFSDFTMSYGYSLGVAGIVRIFDKKRNRLEVFRHMEQAASKCRRCFCHGDLSMANLNSYRNLVIDWDECGIYPIGYDIAKVLLGYLNPSSYNEIEKFLERQFKQAVGDDGWDEFLFSTMFFTFVLGSRKGTESILKNELFEALEAQLPSLISSTNHKPPHTRSSIEYKLPV